jgi:hypothetical protein
VSSRWLQARKVDKRRGTRVGSEDHSLAVSTALTGRHVHQHLLHRPTVCDGATSGLIFALVGMNQKKQLLLDSLAAPLRLGLLSRGLWSSRLPCSSSRRSLQDAKACDGFMGEIVASDNVGRGEYGEACLGGKCSGIQCVCADAVTDLGAEACLVLHHLRIIVSRRHLSPLLLLGCHAC